MSSHISALRRAAYLTILSVPFAAIADNNRYQVENLVSDGGVGAPFTDANLVNGWGVVFNPNGVVWVVDNGTGKSTLYDGTGKPQPLVVRIPPAPKGGGAQGNPTGIVFNGSSDFVVKKGKASGPAVFIFVSEDGAISGWSPAVDLNRARTAVDNSPGGAIYKGLAIGANGSGRLIYAADFHNRRIDVYDAQFHAVQQPGAFEDPSIPRNYGPFGIQNVNGDIYVAYAKQDADAEDEIAGPGLGFVDVFDPDGKLVHRLATHGALNAPWGIALAPKSFGAFGGAVLVGNFGDGTINAFEAHTGAFLGSLHDDRGRRLKIDGLWGISFGNGIAAQPTNALFFAAGPDEEAHGVYGVVRAVGP